MASTPPRAVRWLALLAVAVIVAAPLALHAPSAARADTDLEVGGQAVIADADGDDVRLRAQPGYDGDVIDLFSEGTVVDVLDGPTEAEDGSLWYRVTVDGERGYMVADYLSSLNDGDGGGDAATTSDLNLRAGPSTVDDVLLVIPDGASVALLGDEANGFVAVRYRGVEGWAFGAYLDTGDGSSDGDDAPAIGEATVSSALNLRAGPSTGDAILTVMPGGATVEITGDAENGFYPTRFNGLNGWAFGEFLDVDGAADVPDVGGDIVWPVSGGEWRISQGYNGFSHYNGSSTYQYYYSFDIVRTDGNTAGQPVYAPASGRVRWTERASGGMTIDLGNGYAVAFFHVSVDPGWSDGDPIGQGDLVGHISGPGEDGNMGFDHLHLTVWSSSDGGNWSRVAVPFTGPNAIAGVEYPDTGGFSQWTGTVFYP